MKESRNTEDPEHHSNHNDTIQDGFDGGLHGNEAIHQPQQNTYYDEYFQELNQRHNRLTVLVSRATASHPSREAP